MGKSLALLAFVALFAACAADPTPTSAPTPDIQATVDAAIAEAATAQPTAIPTWTPEPTWTPVPTATMTPVPTATMTPAPSPTPFPASELYVRFAPAVVAVTTPEGLGSGLILEGGRYVLTNAHVVGTSFLITISSPFIGERRAQVLNVNREVDLALLEPLQQLAVSDLPALSSAAPLTPGETVVVMGFAEAVVLGTDSLTVTKGIVSGYRLLEGTTYLQLDAPINPGNSGGPVFKTDGTVVGLATAKLADAEGIGFAIPAGVINSNLPGLKTPQPPTPTPTPTPTPRPTATPTPLPELSSYEVIQEVRRALDLYAFEGQLILNYGSSLNWNASQTRHGGDTSTTPLWEVTVSSGGVVWGMFRYYGWLGRSTCVSWSGPILPSNYYLRAPC